MTKPGGRQKRAPFADETPGKSADFGTARSESAREHQHAARVTMQEGTDAPTSFAQVTRKEDLMQGTADPAHLIATAEQLSPERHPTQAVTLNQQILSLDRVLGHCSCAHVDSKRDRLVNSGQAIVLSQVLQKTPAMLTIITAEARRAAKQQLLADLQDGYSVQETQARAVIPCHPATIYRLRQRLQADPELTLEDGRPPSCFHGSGIRGSSLAGYFSKSTSKTGPPPAFTTCTLRRSGEIMCMAKLMRSSFTRS